MQRRAFVPAAALLSALVAGCSGSSGTNSSATDSKPGGTLPAAAPGKYRTLPEACGAADRGALKRMFPGVAKLPKDQQEKVYAGSAVVTYDTDRRVGCHWKADAADASHQLSVDFERVVSYDTSVSDEDRAKQVYGEKESAADLPPALSTTPSPTATPTPTAPVTGSTAATSPPPSGPAAGDTDDLQPRTLGGLGNAAFLDDLLARAGATGKARTITVVFRTANVIVTVEYSEQPTEAAVVPDSKELQDRTQAMARKLAEQFSD
ncbi:DUF3558 domain-containing protein [Streptomyces beijiangensis]|uniref:DUF3558 domain-containing protein n=1 Tax=Streptomyces beijiangensis TaxID=163361 RepID=A0A939FG66_9ACTN|nr:DUF3558 domain-containing protein [Streptomyces beijiangensis]MBO0516807.1 DUF3558 domain-containing protein [Streptomyces beijiangensis]